MKKLKNFTITIAEVIIETIQDLYGYRLDIKYPNDIMKSGKKLGGILTESFTKGQITEDIIIGIGLNINQIEFSEEVKNIATSLKIEFGEEFDKEMIFIRFLNKFDKEYCKKILEVVK